MRLNRALGLAVALTFVVPAPRLLSIESASAAVRTVKLGDGASSFLTVAMGSTENFATSGSFVDLVVGDPEIADAMPLTDRSFYVHGKKLGATTISAYDAQRRLVGAIEVEVSYNTRRLKDEIRRRVPGANVEISSVNGRILMSGSVTDALSMDRAMSLAKQYGPDVVNSLSISQPQQVMLEVRFIEASRSAGKDLGLNWNISGRSVSATLGAAVSNATPFGTILGKILQGGTRVDVIIDALEQKGLGRRLAEPNLIAMSGQSASFLAGGEFPFPVQGDQGRITVEFKKFGVGLTFTPLVLANGVINLKIEPDVSQIDNTNVISVGGVTVPSLIVRRASTNVELRDGQSFAIAGLLQSVNSENARQLPWIADVPVLGTLFRSASYVRNETDLAIVVTPHLVRPAKPNERLSSPLDATLAANDGDRFLLGRQEVTPKQAGLRTQARGVYGHILDLPRSR